MAQCKLNKIMIVCEKWKRNSLKSDSAMEEIQKITVLKESEMPPCTCAQPKETASCPMKPQDPMACPIKSKESHSCPNPEFGPCPVCHAAGPMTINPFFNFMREMRETTCFNKTVPEVAKEAGERWTKMSDCDKAPYIVQAYKVSRNKNEDGYAPKRNHSGSSMSEPKSKIKKKN
ncbi:uncharacterized protein LOC119077979 [Bradysia coprophila]|uniref:uncharacterized protein LOC119077979 n=1 Tax=Bradysia coprophila TaxID=38358 RepID=UPI00187D97F6|nr:uncharacterized protein LOC119077979 [Bradysia coprophila]